MSHTNINEFEVKPYKVGQMTYVHWKAIVTPGSDALLPTLPHGNPVQHHQEKV